MQKLPSERDIFSLSENNIYPSKAKERKRVLIDKHKIDATLHFFNSFVVLYYRLHLIQPQQILVYKQKMKKRGSKTQRNNRKRKFNDLYFMARNNTN